jgi:SAM-dependent methyltransferase
MQMLQDWLSLVICLDCAGRNLEHREKFLKCADCGAEYPIVQGHPVLLNRRNRVFRPEYYTDEAVQPRPRKPVRLKRFIPDISVNVARDASLSAFKEKFRRDKQNHVLVVGGGSQRASLELQFADSPHIRFIYCDIDIGSDVDCYCDAHELPFHDQTIDGVITTAVLEHVMYPERVAAEISRVLVPGGILYSELPFMQQVHEGAYDFTRYTLSGHRRLFNQFEVIRSGMVAGPATSLLWAIEHFALSFARNQRLRLMVKGGVRMSFFWIKYLDYWLCKQAQATDGASCTYILGRKSVAAVADDAIIAGYIGGQNLRHT